MRDSGLAAKYGAVARFQFASQLKQVPRGAATMRAHTDANTWKHPCRWICFIIPPAFCGGTPLPEKWKTLSHF